MTVVGKKISVPVTVSDVQSVLQTSESTVSALCKNVNINKWSKNKPIKHSSYGPLTDEQRKGEDRTEGYLYGVKCLAFPDKLADLHQYTYEYKRPFGGLGVSPYRMRDFDGYDHNAAPTIEGWFNTTAYRDMSSNFALKINVGGTTTGIDISEVIRNAYSIPAGTDIWSQPLYPCLMVGNYVQVCKNSKIGTPTPILYNGAYYYEYEANITTVPNLQLGSTKFTLFIMMKDSFMEQHFDFANGTQWTNIGGTAQQAFTSSFVTLPNAVGIDVTILDGAPYPPQVIITRVFGVGSRGINVGYDFDTWPTEDITLKVTASSGGGVPKTKELSITSEEEQLKVVYFSYSDLGIRYLEGATVQIDIDMEASNNAGKKTYATATYNIVM